MHWAFPNMAKKNHDMLPQVVPTILRRACMIRIRKQARLAGRENIKGTRMRNMRVLLLSSPKAKL